jgi:5'-3' exonuclease
MILVDYSQVALATILTFQRELKGSEDEVKNLIRHVTLSTIKSYKRKYGKEYGELVICCDGRKYWRKEVFEHYKAWRVVHVDRAEADDIIAVLTEWCQTNNLIVEGLVEEPQKVLILSSDKDFKQLQLAPFSSGNVRQWSPMQKKYITASKQEVMDFTVEHIVKGDAGDGIPNILSKDDVFVVGERQKPVSAKRLAEFIEKGVSACRNDEEKRNWQRNVVLVAFDNIPKDVKSSIVETYISSKPKGDKMTVMNYLMKNRCRLLLQELEEF